MITPGGRRCASAAGGLRRGRGTPGQGVDERPGRLASSCRWSVRAQGPAARPQAPGPDRARVAAPSLAQARLAGRHARTACRAALRGSPSGPATATPSASTRPDAPTSGCSSSGPRTKRPRPTTGWRTWGAGGENAHPQSPGGPGAGTLARRAGLPGVEGGTRAGPLRRSLVAGLAPPRRPDLPGAPLLAGRTPPPLPEGDAKKTGQARRAKACRRRAAACTPLSCGDPALVVLGATPALRTPRRKVTK